MTLTVQSVRSVGFGVLIEQILCGANFMLIGPQENVSLIGTEIKLTNLKLRKEPVHFFFNVKYATLIISQFEV